MNTKYIFLLGGINMVKYIVSKYCALLKRVALFSANSMSVMGYYQPKCPKGLTKEK